MSVLAVYLVDVPGTYTFNLKHDKLGGGSYVYLGAFLAYAADLLTIFWYTFEQAMYGYHTYALEMLLAILLPALHQSIKGYLRDVF